MRYRPRPRARNLAAPSRASRRGRLSPMRGWAVEAAPLGNLPLDYLTLGHAGQIVG